MNRLIMFTLNTGLITSVFAILAFVFVSSPLLRFGRFGWDLAVGWDKRERKEERKTTSMLTIVLLQITAFPHSLLYITMYIPISRLYTNAFLASLNGRSATGTALNQDRDMDFLNFTEDTDISGCNSRRMTRRSATEIAFASRGSVSVGRGNVKEQQITVQLPKNGSKHLAINVETETQCERDDVSSIVFCSGITV